MKFVPITGVKLKKDDVSSSLILTPTSGICRLTPKAVENLGLAMGQRIDIVRHPETGDHYITSGGDTGGAKLSDPSGKDGDGSRLQFSAASAYHTMGGNNSESRYFSIADEGIEDEGGRMCYLLSFDRAEPKVERKSANQPVDSLV